MLTLGFLSIIINSGLVQENVRLKFKSVFIIFNIIIIFLLLIICFFPLLIPGSDLMLNWRAAIRPLALVPALIFIILDIFYFSNHRLFVLLEREDWPALTGYLETRILRDGHYSSPLVRILANTYLVMSDAAAVLSLENRLTLVKPALLETHALIFGAARLLSGDSAGAARFFSTRLEPGQARGRSRPWVRWYYGFSLMLDRQFTPAAEQFEILAEESPEALITGLSAYFLGDILQRNTEEGARYLAAALRGRSRLRRFVRNRKAWQRAAARIETEVHAVILREYIDEAGRWLFDSP
jgi:hypothetical protein